MSNFFKICVQFLLTSANFAERFNRGGGGSKLTTPLAEKFFKHEKRAIKYHSQNAYIMRKTLEIKGFSLYQPFGCFVSLHPLFNTIQRNILLRKRQLHFAKLFKGITPKNPYVYSPIYPIALTGQAFIAAWSFSLSIAVSLYVLTTAFLPFISKSSE